MRFLGNRRNADVKIESMCSRTHQELVGLVPSDWSPHGTIPAVLELYVSELYGNLCQLAVIDISLRRDDKYDSAALHGQMHVQGGDYGPRSIAFQLFESYC